MKTHHKGTSILINQNKSHHKGMSVVELLIGAAILLGFIVALVVVFQSFLVQSFNSIERVQATFLAEEGLEAMKAIRDQDWDMIDALNPGITYYVEYQSDVWNITSNEVSYVDGVFERTVTVSEVLRDGNDDIAVSGTVDPDTIHVAVDVSWNTGSATTTHTLETYITNFHDE